MAEFDPIASGQAIGQGLAQIVGPFEDKYGALAAKEIAAKKEKESDAQKELIKDLAGLRKADILPGDEKVFADKQTKIYDFARNNIDALLKGDVDKTLEFNQMMTQFATDAAHSKNYRENIEGISKTMLINRPKFSDEAFQALENDRKSSFDDQGKYKSIGIDAYTMLQKPVELNDYFNKQMLPRIDVVNKKYTTKVMENGKYITKKYDLNTPEDVRAVYDSIYQAAPQEIKDEIDFRFGNDPNTEDQESAQDWGYKNLAKYLEKDVVGTEETKIPQRVGRVSRPRAAAEGKKVTFDIGSAATANLPHWNRTWEKDGGITDPVESKVTIYTVPTNRDLDLQLTPSKYYVAYKSSSNRQTGSWIDKPTNVKLKFGNIQYVPVVTDGTGNERFLDQSEIETGKIRGTSNPLKNPRMKAVIPTLLDGQNIYIDAEEKAVANKIKQSTGQAVPTWDEVRSSLQEQGVEIPSWAAGGGGKGTTSGKKYTIKGKEYSAEQVEAKAKESGMTAEEYVKALNEMK